MRADIVDECFCCGAMAEFPCRHKLLAGRLGNGDEVHIDVALCLDCAPQMRPQGATHGECDDSRS